MDTDTTLFGTTAFVAWRVDSADRESTYLIGRALGHGLDLRQCEGSCRDWPGHARIEPLDADRVCRPGVGWN